MTAGPAWRPDLASALESAHRSGVALQITDLDLALTLLDRAEGTSDSETRLRTTQLARDALKSVQSFLLRLRPTLEEAALIDERVLLLTRRLEKLGR